MTPIDRLRGLLERAAGGQVDASAIGDAAGAVFAGLSRTDMRSGVADMIRRLSQLDASGEQPIDASGWRALADAAALLDRTDLAPGRRARPRRASAGDRAGRGPPGDQPTAPARSATLELAQEGYSVADRTAAELKAVTEKVFVAAGAPRTSARVAEALVGANLAGHDSHGVIRIPAYVSQSRPAAHPVGAAGRSQGVRHDRLVDGNWTFGQVTAPSAPTSPSRRPRSGAAVVRVGPATTSAGSAVGRRRRRRVIA